MGTFLRWTVAVTVVALIGATIAFFAPLSAPVTDSTSAHFWACAFGVDVGPNRLDIYGKVFPPHDGYYLFWFIPNGGLPIHGARLRRVPVSEVHADFPKVLERLDPSTRSAEFQEWLRTARRDNVSPDAFLLALRRARLAALREADLTESSDREDELARERAVRDFWPQANRYWLNITFEFVYLSGLALFILWPWLRRKPWWRQAIHWGLVPLILLVPYYLSYCPESMTYPSGRAGVVYPFAICLLGQVPSSGLDVIILENIPPLLSSLTQFPDPTADISEAGGGPTSAIGIGLALAAVYALFHRLHVAFHRRLG
jgi:hypothetical protein